MPIRQRKANGRAGERPGLSRGRALAASLQYPSRRGVWPSGSVAVEPVRVKVYGLFSLTKRRYLTQAVAGVVFAALIFAGLVVRLAAAARPPDAR